MMTTSWLLSTTIMATTIAPGIDLVQWSWWVDWHGWPTLAMTMGGPPLSTHLMAITKKERKITLSYSSNPYHISLRWRKNNTTMKYFLALQLNNGRNNGMCVYIYICMCLCVYIYMYVFVCIWCGRERERRESSRWMRVVGGGSGLWVVGVKYKF